MSQRRERVELADTTHAWLLSLRRRVAKIEKETPEGLQERKQLVESISVGRQDDGRAEVQITYRSGPPPGLSEAPEDSSVVHLKNGSLS